jgi:class 3 adenylate cyclase/pimeloyl-ACP methyl ester carboxylesterase
MQPETRYARSGDVHVAYQVFGDGTLDLVIVPGWVSHLELVWEEPQATAFLRRLGEFTRVIMFDKRGTGMSDPIPYAPLLDERMDDIRAVMDAAGSTQAALLGYSEGGPLALVFAATHPERVTAVIPYASFARLAAAPDYPAGIPVDVLKQWPDLMAENARTGAFYSLVVPSREGDQHFKEWFARFSRLAASPAQMQFYMESNMAIDVRDILPSIRVPTLVMHRRGDNLCRVEHGRYLAKHIPNAKYVELDGGDHWPWFGDTEAVVEEIEEFLTGQRHVGPTDRVLVTVMFTDIVGSTELVAQMGDKAWRQLLDRHDAVTSRQVERFRGRELKHTGDGMLATFEGPARAVQCARAIQEATRAIGVEVRVGVHVGECELRGDDIGGLAVHIAARVADAAAPGQVLVSSTVKDLATGSGIEFNDCGVRELRGVPGEWHLFELNQNVAG